MASPATDSTKPDADEDMPMKSDDESSNSGSSSGEEEEQTEWLATTRQKRSTAGNRLSTLIQQAAAEDDELELLFAEDEDDVGFEDVEDDASDVQMDSSDDDDDQGPTAGAEELDGEKELQQQARAERQAKKRKANDGIPKAFRKKVKIDPTAPKSTPPRPKKKSERASWIPTPEDAPTRASARSTTKISKEQLHAQMLEREKRRLRQLAIMEKAEKKKNAEKPKEITQEDRLAEAVRVETRNAQSLNSWEEAEKIREEERRAKLEALHNRKMQGPYITWWSGLAEWVGGKLKRVGKNITIEEKQKGTAGRKRKADEMQEEASMPSFATPLKDTAVGTNSTSSASLGPSQEVVSIDATPSQAQAPTLESQPPSSIHCEIRAGEGVSANGQPSVASNAPQSHALSLAESPAASTPTALDGSAPLPGFYNPPQAIAPSDSSSMQSFPPRMMPSQTMPFTFAPAPPAPLAPELPPVVEKGTYNCLILENLDETAMKLKDNQCQVLFHRKFPKTHSMFMVSFRTAFSPLVYFSIKLSKC
jgi:vacuolar protein sorting-associated protein 72